MDQTVQKRGLAVAKPETEAMYGIFYQGICLLLIPVPRLHKRLRL